MDSQLSELRDHVIDLRSRVGEHISGKHSNTLQQVDHKLVEILDLLQDADQPDIAKQDTIGQATNKIRDDLTLIQGVSEELAEMLNESNVSQFQTIADWTSDDVRHFGKLLSTGFLIQKQNWIEQAQILSTGRDTSFSRTAKQGYRLVAPPHLNSRMQINKILTGKFTEKLPVQDDSPNSDIPVGHQEELSAQPVVGRTQSFFRPPEPHSESVQFRETEEKTQGRNEKIRSAAYQKEEAAAKTETTPEDGQNESNSDSEQSEDITIKEKEPDKQNIESLQNSSDSSVYRRKTFPDFRLFSDSSSPNTSSDSERSDESIGSPPNSQTGNERGAMRRFFRAITKSEKS